MPHLKLQLVEQLRALVQQHGVEAVRDAVEFVVRVQGAPEVSREDKRRLSELCSVLRVSYAREDFNPFMCLKALIKVAAPPKTCIEILERLVAYRPTHPWAWLNRAMRQDYPQIPWGRHAPGEQALEPALAADDAPPADDDDR